MLGQKRHIGYLNSLKEDSRSITTYGVTFLTKPSNQNTIVLLAKFKQPSLGTGTVILLPCLLACLLAEFGCFGLMPTCSSTVPFAWEAPPTGLVSTAVPQWAPLCCVPCHFWDWLVTVELHGGMKTATVAHPASTTGPGKGAGPWF